MNLKQKVKSLAEMPISGLFELLYLRIIGRDILVSGSCNGCGNCCRLINLRSTKGWITSKKHFDKLVKKNTDFKRFSIVSEDNSGYLLFSCSWLRDDGTCKDYEKRLSICKNYPNKSMILCGGKLLPECGFQINKVVPFKKILVSEIKSLKNLKR